jgi:LuxR family transcriptional regulator, maltose regulon positive regulatory protein
MLQGYTLSMSMLLESKFFQPRPRQAITVRPRLLEQLNTGLQRKLILVLAQAGFGKSTLAAQWLNLLGQEKYPASAATPYRSRVAWLALDENDNDPLRFFDYLITALQRADAGVGQHARYLLSAPQPPTTLEPLVISLINDLTNLSGHLILALDDYHTITSQEVHQAIHYFISHAPDLFHLMLISRVEPPLPLTRWRMYRELTEVREHDLRFTLDEAMSYLIETMHCTLSRADVVALEQRTEGWIVGLHLAALSLQSRPDTAAFIADFTGSHAYIVDYLTEEVLHRQPAEIQEFLFRSSPLARFNGSLCDAVVGRTGSQKILEYLERTHLFVIPLDNERGWYRYHHLFAEMLRRRAQEHDPQQTRESYRRATQWYIDKEMEMEAIEYALAAGDDEHAAELIERSLPFLLARGHFVTLLQWLDQLAPAILRARPLLCITRARVAMRKHNIDEAEKWLAIAQEALAAYPDQDINVIGEIYALRVDILLNRSRVAETIQLANEALELLPADLYRPRGEILLFLGIAYYWDDQFEQASAITKEATQVTTRAGDILSALYAWANFVRFYQAQGKLREAMAAQEQTIAFAADHNVHQQSMMASSYNNRGEIYYEWNMLEEAEADMLEGIRLAEQAHNPRALLRSHSLLVSLYQASGQPSKADEMLQRVLQLARQYQLPMYILNDCTKSIVQKWLNDSNLTAVADWIKQRGLSDTPDPAAIRGLETEYGLVARYLAAKNDLPAADALLEKAAASAQRSNKMTIYVAIQAFHALVRQQMGDGRGAFELLTLALEVGEPAGFMRSFLDEGKAMQTLLNAIQPRLTPKFQHHVALLLQAFGQPQEEVAQPVLSTLDGEYIERLSDRELEVLRLVDDGLSDSQIAAKLILAIGTVKRHLNNIYGKLGVHNRTHALARARTLQLL